MALDPTKPVCKSCGAAITLLEQASSGLCSRLECQTPYLQQKKQQAERAREEKRRDVSRRALQILHLPPDSSACIAVVPSVEAPIARLLKDRRERFKESIEQILITLERPTRDDADHPETMPAGSQEGPAKRHLINACASCRGSCCQYGRDHAFVDADILSDFWQRRPELTPEEIVKLYVDQLPEESVSGSCVYHTAHGCCLDRDMRGSTCNDFLCEGIRVRLQDWQADPDESFAVAVTEAGDIRRIGISRPDSVHEETWTSDDDDRRGQSCE